MQSLFKPGAKINQDHKHKYIHILAYAASVVEMWKKVMFGSVNNTIFTYSGLTVLKKTYGCEVAQFKTMYSVCFIYFNMKCFCSQLKLPKNIEPDDQIVL